MHGHNNIDVWDKFEQDFIQDWDDTNAHYKAAAELDKLKMEGSNIDHYITKFTELARKVQYHEDDLAVLEKFKHGLPVCLLEAAMHHDQPANWEQWKLSTCMLRSCVPDYYFSPLFPLPCLVDCAPSLLSITCLTLAFTVLHTRASVPADVHPLCTVHARISSPLPYVSLHLPCTLPYLLTCVVPRPLYALP